MKKSVISAICLLSIVTLFANTPQNPAKIEEVKQGKCTQADASWWGYNEEDATECLQQAIHSGAKTLIVPNLGTPWILSKPVELASNQELVLAKGTVIQAKKGAFQNQWLGLFFGHQIKNSIFRGEGENILCMNIEDYNDQKLYKVSEWRHGIYMAGCENIKISNLHIKDTGGDGMAIGNGDTPCRNMLIENVIFDNCNRLGVGMVSGDNITFRKCTFMNAHHMPPCGGIDMEPNKPNECISNILIEDCLFKNNNFNAITLAVYNLDEKSAPVSLTIRNCREEGNRMSFDIQGMKKTGNGCKGSVIMENCKLTATMRFANVTSDNFSVLIKDTEMVLPEGDAESAPSVAITSNGNHDMEIGGIVFDNVKITSPENSKRKNLEFNFDGLARCSAPVKGTLYYNGKQIDFAPSIKECNDKLAALRTLQMPVMPEFSTLVPAKIAAEPFNAGNRLPLRRAGKYIISGTKGQKLSFKTKIWDFYKSEGFMVIKAPSGKQIDKTPLPFTQTTWTEYSFVPEETGIYTIEYNPNINAVEFRTDFPSGYLAEKGELVFVKTHGRMYFTVPAGTDTFSFSIASNAGADARIFDPSGKIAIYKKNIKAAERLTINLEKDTKDQVWAIEILNSVWEVTMRMYAPLVPILSENPELLLTSGK